MHTAKRMADRNIKRKDASNAGVKKKGEKTKTASEMVKEAEMGSLPSGLTMQQIEELETYKRRYEKACQNMVMENLDIYRANFGKLTAENASLKERNEELQKKYDECFKTCQILKKKTTCLQRDAMKLSAEEKDLKSKVEQIKSNCEKEVQKLSDFFTSNKADFEKTLHKVLSKKDKEVSDTVTDFMKKYEVLNKSFQKEKRELFRIKDEEQKKVLENLEEQVQKKIAEKDEEISLLRMSFSRQVALLKSSQQNEAPKKRKKCSTVSQETQTEVLRLDPKTGEPEHNQYDDKPLRREISSLKKLLEDKAKHVKSLEEEKRNLQTRNFSSQSYIKFLELKLSEHNKKSSTITEYKKVIDNHEKDRTVLATRIKELETELKILADLNDDLELRLVRGKSRENAILFHLQNAEGILQNCLQDLNICAEYDFKDPAFGVHFKNILKTYANKKEYNGELLMRKYEMAIKKLKNENHKVRQQLEEIPVLRNKLLEYEKFISKLRSQFNQENHKVWLEVGTWVDEHVRLTEELDRTKAWCKFHHADKAKPKVDCWRKKDNLEKPSQVSPSPFRPMRVEPTRFGPTPIDPSQADHFQSLPSFIVRPWKCLSKLLKAKPLKTFSDDEQPTEDESKRSSTSSKESIAVGENSKKSKTLSTN